MEGRSTITTDETFPTKTYDNPKQGENLSAATSASSSDVHKFLQM